MKLLRAFAIGLMPTLVMIAAQAHRGFVTIKSFEITPPALGTYVPWKAPGDAEKWHAGEKITLTETGFHYAYFTDCVDPDHPTPNFSGKVMLSKDMILLSHPGISFPYRITGKADGQSVMLTWRAYEQWKKTKSVLECDLLYLEQSPSKSASKVPNRSME